VLGPGEGRSLAPAAGAAISLKSASEETDGGWTLLEYSAPPHFAGPPPHWHAKMEEAFFVLEGTVRAGGYARVPPGVVHRFSNTTDQPSRFLGLAVPGGLEKYLEELAEMMANQPARPPADMAPVVALMAAYDTFPPPAPEREAASE
jgi:mannose-6-phosphate isomerase-like protein (cupin superfamily)